MKGIPSVKLALPVLVAALAVPAAASAQVPTPPTTPAPPQGSQPTPAPAPAKLTAFVKSGLIDHGRHYVLSGDRVLVTGRLKPAVGGQKVLVELLRKGKRVAAAHAKVGKGGHYR